jgi:hypothetical protein
MAAYVTYAADVISKHIITILKVNTKLSTSRVLLFKAFTVRSSAGSKLY